MAKVKSKKKKASLSPSHNFRLTRFLNAETRLSRSARAARRSARRNAIASASSLSSPSALSPSTSAAAASGGAVPVSTRGETARQPTGSERAPNLPINHRFTRSRNANSTFFVQEAGYKFKVTLGQSKRWQRFRTDRRQYRMVLVRSPEQGDGDEDHLVQNLFYSRLLERLVRELVADIRRRHREARRPNDSLLTLALNADGLEYPIVTDIGELFDDRVGQDLFARLSRVLTSQQNLALDRHFYVHATVVDVQNPQLFLMAGLSKKSHDWMPTSWKDNSMLSCLRGSTALAPMPQNKEDPFWDCCLLFAIEIRMIYNSRKESKEDGLLWTRVKRQAEASRVSARTALYDCVRVRVHENGLNVNVFRKCSLGDDLRQEVDKMKINLIVINQADGYRKAFQHPLQYDFARPCVEILSVSFLNIMNQEVKSGQTSDHNSLMPASREVHHAAAILKYELLHDANSSIKLCCKLCGRYFGKRNIYQHNCNISHTKRSKCLQCKRYVFMEGDYKDEQMLKMLCNPNDPTFVNKKCGRCEGDLKNRNCKNAHARTRCGYSSKKCPKCQVPVLAKRLPVHVCGEVFCRTCKDFLPREHSCQMARPAVQKHVDLLAFFDTETFPYGKEENHHVNAVGLSFESRDQPGVFSEVFFYDDTMHHPQDGRVDADNFSHQYWTDKMLSDKHLSRSVPPKSLNKKSLHWKYSQSKDSSSFKNQDEADPSSTSEFFDLEAGAMEVEEDCFTDTDQEEMEQVHDAILTQVQSESNLTKVEEYEDGEVSALDKFLDFILDVDFFGYVFLAHAGSRFDHMLLIRKLVQREIAFVPIFDGHKALQISIPALKMRFIDSYRYIKLPLAKFNVRFPQMQVTGRSLNPNESSSVSGIQNMKKGTFPYKMNHPDFYDYEGVFPEESYFLDEFSSHDKEEEYIESKNSWPAEKVWKLKEQLHLYLAQDVRVLRGGALSLLKEFYLFQQELQDEKEDELVFFHPFSRPFFTSSSFVHGMWQYFELPPDTFFLVSNQRNARKTSRGELEWLSFLSYKTKTKISTAHSSAGGQVKVGKYWVDGMCAEEGVIYEFNGCAVHYHAGGERDCPLSSFLNSSSTNPFGHVCLDVWQRWQEKFDTLKKMGYEVVVMWECEYEKLKRESEELQHFLQHVYYVDGRPSERLRLRSALRGGRVESFRLLFHEEASTDKELFYVDKNSLYPAVAIFNEFPSGVHEVLVGEDCQVRLSENGFADRKGPFWGLIQATVLPPDSLFLPLLPYNVGGKLKFGLCRTCLETMSSKLCSHSDQERWLTDVWTTAELEYAVSCGYKLVRVWEAFAYRQMKPVFRKFYSRLAKIKLESEGFPDGVDSDLQKQQYCQSLNDAMPGLALEWKSVSKNPARRQFAKDVSNIGLGKFSQNDLRNNVVYVSSWQELAEIRFNDPKKILKNVVPITEYLAEVSYEPNDLLTGYHRNTHVVVYAFVTAYARIGMMKDMRQLMSLGARIFYTDTDSIIFDFPKTADKSILNTAFNMGSKAYNAYKYETVAPIASFATLGAKNYSYRTRDGETCVKSRGFTLTNAKAMSVLNHDSMRSLLDKFLLGETQTLQSESFRMVLDRKTQTVKSGTVVKNYSNNVFDKRYVLPLAMGKNQTACTLAFGTKHVSFQDCNVNSWK